MTKREQEIKIVDWKGEDLTSEVSKWSLDDKKKWMAQD
jgi:hypothetical protein